MLLSWANPPDLKLSKKCLAFNIISGLPYLGVNSVVVYLWLSAFVCRLLPSSGQVWPLLECVGYQKLHYLVLIIHLSKSYLMPVFPVHSIASWKFLSWVSLLPNTCTSSAIPTAPLQFSYILGQSSSQRCLDPSPTQKAFSGVLPLTGCVEGCHEWWYCIHIPISLFYIYLWKKL